MSIQCGVDCLDCREFGPSVGDGGYLGAPVLAAIEDCEAGDPMPSFGWFYEPLMLLGIRRYDLEEFREFLLRHEGHRLYLSGDHDNDVPPELAEMERWQLESDDPSDAAEESDRRREERTASGEFKVGVYEVSCPDCTTTYAAEEPELLRSFETLVIDRQAVDLFLERWASRSPDDGWNHRLLGLVDPFEPFMAGLPAYVRKHAGHRLEARLRPEE